MRYHLLLSVKPDIDLIVDTLCSSVSSTHSLVNDMGGSVMFRNFLGSVVLSLICSALYGEDWLPVYEEGRQTLKPVI